jgi:aconitase A
MRFFIKRKAFDVFGVVIWGKRAPVNKRCFKVTNDKGKVDEVLICSCSSSSASEMLSMIQLLPKKTYGDAKAIMKR